jgi:hypothetical protein
LILTQKCSDRDLGENFFIINLVSKSKLKNIEKHKVKNANFQPFFAHEAHKTNETIGWFSTFTSLSNAHRKLSFNFVS